MGDWVGDVEEMHRRFGHAGAVSAMTDEARREFLAWRLRFVAEEADELARAHAAGDPAGVVDALVDVCVVAIGTMDAFGVDARRAWAEVMGANSRKEAGRNPSRPNAFGLPDLVKPDGWVGPDHSGNLGLVAEALSGEVARAEEDDDGED